MEDQDTIFMRLEEPLSCKHCWNGNALKKSMCEKCNQKLIEKSEDDNAKAMCTKLEIGESTNYAERVGDAEVENGASNPEFASVQKDREEMHNLLDDKPQRMNDEVVTNKIVELLPKLETDEKKVEELEEAKESIDENYKENDKSEKILMPWLTKEDTKDKKEDESSKTNDEISFLCPSCERELPLLGEGFTVNLEKCHHTLCRWCMTELLKTIIKDTTVEPRCPYIVEGLFKCNLMIQEHQIRELVEPKLYEAYLEKSISKIKEDPRNRIFYCRTPTCQAWYIMEDDNVNTFLCTLCKVNNYVDKTSNKSPEETLTDTEQYILSERYKEILQLSESGIVPNFESFECPICFVEYEPREGLILKNCLHTFCKACISNVVIYSEDADIKCPYKNDDYSCDEMILQSEIRAVVKPEEYQTYLQKSIVQVERKAGKSAFHCKTPNCPDWCFYEPDVDHFLCPTCKQDNCLLCQKIHTGRGCADNITSENPDDVSVRSEAAIEIMLRNGNALLCPTCKAVITKTDGCDAITCAACKTEICWVTRGPRWGPGGKGDTSGGCKCSPNAKCHPNCRNCH